MADPRSRGNSPAVRLLAPLAFWLGVWAVAAWWKDSSLILPGPGEVLLALVEMGTAPAFWGSAAHSLIRILLGLVAGVAAGAALAALTSAWEWAHRVFSPAVRLVRATPVSSFILLVLLWVPTGVVPAIIAGLMVLPVVWGAVSGAVARTDPQLLEVARCYRFSRRKTLKLVYIPWALPAFITACHTSLGLAWKAGVAAEVLCRPRYAVGSRIYESKLYLETPQLFAWTMVVIVLSFLLEWGMGAVFHKLERRGAEK